MADTLLAQLRRHLKVDLDSMDPNVAVRHTTSTDAFGDMTSNQAIVYNEAIKPERQHVVDQAVAIAKSQGSIEDEDTFLDLVVNILTVLLAKEVHPHITGNVHAQTSPSAAHDTGETIRQAKTLVSLFNDQGIPRNRVCIKIPATPESLIACRSLGEMGIQTLATCLFSLPQALAAAQAGCVYVAPYFNELRVHFEPTLWKAYENADDHPMCAVIRSIVQTFKAIKTKTLVMPASIVTADEVLALARLEPDHITLSPAILDKLATLPLISDEALKSKVPSSVTETVTENEVPDFLANGGQQLRQALATDAEVTRKLSDALAIFHEREVLTKSFIKSLL